MLFSRFQTPFEIKAHLWHKLAADWTIAGREWVNVDIIVDHGTSIELRLRFWDEDGEDSNVFNPPISSHILKDVRRYLRPCRAYLYQFFIEDLGGGRQSFRLGVGLIDHPHNPNDSGCEG